MKECLQCQSCYEDVLSICPVDNTSLQDGLPGSTILTGKFRIEARLGQGGMGTVYRAMHLGLKRYVALKTLLPQNQSQLEFAERFRREAEASGRIKHPHVVDVMDFGFATVGRQEVGYLVMEFLEGQTLGSLLKTKGRLSLELAVDILNQICQAVTAAHQLGIIHRDLKPHNIWLEDRPNGYHVKVLDFGLAKISDRDSSTIDQLKSEHNSSINPTSPSSAKTLCEIAEQEIDPLTEIDSLVESDLLVESDFSIESSENSAPTRKLKSAPAVASKSGRSKTDGEGIAGTNELVEQQTNYFLESIDSMDSLTHTGAMIGTLSYMSPEQCLAKPCTIASDIYSLGIIAYEMLVGQRPFQSKSYELIVAHVSELPKPPSEIVPELPKSVEAAILSAMAKDPAQRPVSAVEFAALLGAHLVEAQRKQLQIRKIIRLGAMAAAVLLITTIMGNWLLIGEYSHKAMVGLGLTKGQKTSLNFSKLKLTNLIDGKEIVLTSTNPTHAPVTEKSHFNARFSADGKLVAIWQPQHQQAAFELWDVEQAKKLRDIELADLPDNIYDLQFSDDHRQIIVSSLVQVRIIDSETGKQTDKVSTFDNNDYVRLLPANTDTLLTASVHRPFASLGINSTSSPLRETNSNLSLWRISNGDKLLDLVYKYGEIEAIRTSFSQNGNWALIQWRVSEREPSRRIELWRLDGNASRVKEWQVAGPGGGDISADGNRLILRLLPSQVVELDRTTDKELTRYDLPSSHPATLHYNKQGHLIVTSEQDIQDLTEHKTIFTIPADLHVIEINNERLIAESEITQEH